MEMFSIEYMSLELEGDFWVGNTNLEVVNKCANHIMLSEQTVFANSLRHPGGRDSRAVFGAVGRGPVLDPGSYPLFQGKKQCLSHSL